MAPKFLAYGVSALVLTLLSVFYIRQVPTVVGNLCGPQGNEFCYEPLPRAGFPLSYWLDRGGISIEGKLQIYDDFSIIPFGADFLFYLLVVIVGHRLTQRWRRRE